MDDSKHEPKRSRGLVPYFLLIPILLYFVKSVNGLDSEIESMREEGLQKFDISVYIEERVEFIHSKIDLKPLLNGIRNAKKLSTDFDRSQNTSLGKILSRKIANKLSRMSSKITSMSGTRIDNAGVRIDNPGRSKRALEFVGNLISKLFGNPGPEDWRQNNANILAMKSAIERQLSNSVILRDSIDANSHEIEKQNLILRQATLEIYNNEKRLSNVDTEINEIAMFMEVENMFDAIDDILEDLTDIKRDAKTGRCNERGLSPKFLVEQLRKIETNKNGIAPIFASWEHERYYSHEMCAVALHDNALWITLRIPIINLAEQLIRAIPTSSQKWIKDTLSDYGFESALFKDRMNDKFMVITESYFETCSVLGTSRVCNIRRTKFSESNPFIAPVDIGHNRILMLSNSSESALLSMACEGRHSSLTISQTAIMNIPANCTVRNKKVEIDTKRMNEIVSTALELEEIRDVSIRKVYKSKTNLIETSMNHTRHSFALFDHNINRTISDLQQITIRNRDDLMHIAYKAAGGIGLSLALTFIGYILLKCLIRKKCRASRKSIRIDDVESANCRAEPSDRPNGSKNLPSDNCQIDKSVDNEINDEQAKIKTNRRASKDSLFGANN